MKDIRINRLVIIGNGVDLAHGLKTKYEHFIGWYLKDFFSKLFSSDNIRQEYGDALLSISVSSKHTFGFSYSETYRNDVNAQTEYEQHGKEVPIDFLTELENLQAHNVDEIYVSVTELLERILSNLDNGWCDIESDYYELLKEKLNIERDIDVKRKSEDLNNQLDYLREKLAEYLDTQKTTTKIPALADIVNSNIVLNDIAPSCSRNFEYCPAYSPNTTVLLDFNYTPTSEMYVEDSLEIRTLHIHGTLENRNLMIFGYGDEMDQSFEKLENRNVNELLKNSKSVKYLETSNYHKLLNFIGGLPFQVFIMGHSCGNSDRTLLNTIFEHDNCISIKPFYYKWGEGENEDTYSDITRNIYRNFKDKTLFRDRVVNKEQCEALPQASK